MNADMLLAHFDRLSEAPNAVSRLRRFILDLAVRGKLVDQDPKDEPASVFLRGRRSQPSSAPWPLPRGWDWSSLGQLGDTYGGGTPSKGDADYWNGLIPWVSPKDMKVDWISDAEDHISDDAIKYSSARLIPAGALLMVVRGMILSHSFPTAVSTVPLTINQDMKAIVPFRSDFAQMLLLLTKGVKPEVMRLVQRSTHGTCKLLTDQLFSMPIPIPPLAEQHRIVAKVDELMALCDRLEAAQSERERCRTRLTSASLARLNQTADEPAFRDHVQFHLRHFPRFTIRPDQIPQLRQTILNLAVRGKLLPQDPNDEPASETVKQLKPMEKPTRYASRSPELIIGDCGLSVGNPRTPVPKGWVRVPMVEIARLESGHTPSRDRPDWWGGEIPWMGLVDARLHHGKVIRTTIQYTNREGIANSAARVLPAGTVCFSRTASVGYVVIMGRPMATSQDFVNWVPSDAITSEWLQLVLIAEKPALSRFSKGAVHQTIYYPAWLSMHITLPPLAEQYRIVAKVEELMVVCDRLEAELTTMQAESRRLLEAVLHQALDATA
jgi:type I restriction enzyme S subunit